MSGFPALPLDNVIMALSSTPFDEGAHVTLTDRSMLPFQHVKDLGRGASAVVDVVQHKTTGKQFAHKAFSSRRDSRDLQELKQMFKNEMDIIKRLHSHPHLIQIYCSYTCGETFGMLLTPVASDGDLKAFLRATQTAERPPTQEQCSILSRAFGCLASGLAFVHKSKIRHKDIKPANILIHEGQMIITDFGIALDASEEDTTTTTGAPGAFTDRYRAPEVARYEPRNRKSDVFSLGCVFLEIMASLAPGTDMRTSDKRPYWIRVDDVQDNLIHLSNSDSSLHQMCLIFSSMLQHSNTDRVNAEAVLHRMRTIGRSQSEPSYELICKDCGTSASSTSENSTRGAMKMLDRNLEASDREEQERSQDAPTFSRHISHRPYSTRQAAIEAVVFRPLSQGERQEGYFYIFQHPHNSDFIKVGWTRDVTRRVVFWGRHYKYDIKEYKQGNRVLVLNAPRVERLVITHLGDVRYKENCQACHMKHLEWFRTTPEYAARVVEKYSDWMERVRFGPLHSLSDAES